MSPSIGVFHFAAVRYHDYEKLTATPGQASGGMEQKNLATYCAGRLQCDDS